MNEITFIVEEAREGGFNARALGASIFTEADDISDLHSQTSGYALAQALRVCG